MSTQKTTNNPNRFRFLSLIFCLLSGSGFSAFIFFRIPSIWEEQRLTRIGLLVLFILFFVMVFILLFNMTKNMYTNNSKAANQISIFTSILFSLLIFLIALFGEEGKVPAQWLQGFGVPNEIVVNFIVLVFAFPFLAFFSINLLGLIAKRIFKNGSNFNIKANYPSFFGIFLLVVSLGTMLFSFKYYGNLNNKFTGSKDLERVYSLVRYYLGDKIYQDAIISKGNWLVFATDVSLDDYQNVWPLSENQLKKIDRKVGGLKDYLASKGVKLIIIIPPNKNTIYPEYLPKEIPVIGQVSRYDQVNQLFLADESLGYVDLREILLNERENGWVYYATDTHWNPHGAYFAYEAVINKINEYYPDIKPHSLDDYLYERTPERDGDVAVRLVNIDIQEDFYQLKLKNEIEFEYREIQDRHRQYIVPNLVAPKLLVFHDSFGAGLISFLKDHFRSSVFIHGTSIDLFMVETENPDIVMIEWTERTLIRFLNLPDL